MPVFNFNQFEKFEEKHALVNEKLENVSSLKKSVLEIKENVIDINEQCEKEKCAREELLEEIEMLTRENEDLEMKVGRIREIDSSVYSIMRPMKTENSVKVEKQIIPLLYEGICEDS